MTTRRLLPIAALLLAGACTIVNDPEDLDPGPDTTPPAAPTGLVATPGNGEMRLEWEAVGDRDLAHYEVYAALTTQPLALVGQAAGSSFTVTGLENDQVYDFMVQAVDRSGNVSESSEVVTAQPDGVAPTGAFSFNPGPQSGASVMTDVIFTFSEPMAVASVEGSASVTSNASVTPTCVWSWYSGGTEAKCDLVVAGNPSTPLEYARTYTVTLANGATDRAGNPLVGTPIAATFTTAAAPDLDPPGFVSVTVSNYQSPSQPVGAIAPGAQGVFPETNVVFTFDEPMDTVSTAGAISVTGGAGYNGGTKSWNAAGTVMTFNPDLDYPADGRLVTITIGGGAQDAAGNPLPAWAPRTFQVAYQASATLYSEPSIDGYSLTSAGGASTTAYATGDSLYVGDSASAGQYKGYLSFSRAGLSVNLTRFREATLYAYQHAVNGTPYTDLQSLYVCGIILGGGYKLCDRDVMAVHVDLGTSLGASDATAPTLSGSYEISTSETLGSKSVGVLAAVEADRLAGRSRTQFRLEFPVSSDGDYVSDYGAFYTGDFATTTLRPRLVVSYEYY